MKYQLNHSLSLNSINENNDSEESKMQLLCNIKSRLNDYNRRVFKKISLTPHSIFMLFLIVFALFLHLLSPIKLHNAFSMWFSIATLVVILVVNVIVYCCNYQWNLKGFPSISMEKMFDVRRNGIVKCVKFSNIECGDIIKLQCGDQVPVDIRITNCNNLQIQNDTFSQNILDTDFLPEPTDDNILMSKNVLYQGSEIMSGTVTGTVINQANHTCLAHALNQIIHYFRKDGLSHKYPFTNKLFSSITGLLIYFWIGITFYCLIVLIYQGCIQARLLYTSIGIALSISTPTLLIIALLFRTRFQFLLIGLFSLISGIKYSILTYLLTSIIINQRHFKKCKLSNPEFSITLGQLNVIVINDLSMFYQNKLNISNVWIDGNSINYKSITEDFEKSKFIRSSSWTAIARASVLCNEAYSIDNPVIGTVKLEPETNSHGDTDHSILDLFHNSDCIQKWGGSLPNYIHNNVCLYGVKYDPLTKCKMSIHKLNDGDSRLLLVLQGNIMDILQCSDTILIDGIEKNIELWKENILEYFDEIAKYNSTIRAFCDFRLNPDLFTPNLKEINSDLEQSIPRKGLRFIGIISLTEVLRPSFVESLEKCKKLGLGIVFTFERNETSFYSITQELNFDEFKTISASVADSWSQNHLANILNESNLIITDADTKTHQKLIKSCQNKRQSVGVIESNVNRLVNLLSADVGIVPQVKCNNLCKQLADVSVTDDQFITLIDAIQKSKDIFKIFAAIFNFICFPKTFLLLGFLFSSWLGIPLIVNFSFVLSLELCFLLPLIFINFELFHNTDSIFQKQKLINYGLIIQVGCIQMAGAMFTYIAVMSLHGFWPSRLFMIKNRWYSEELNDISDSYGQEWTYNQRMKLNILVSTSVFYTICVLQIFAMIVSANNYQSIFSNFARKYRLIILFLSSVLLIFLMIYGASSLKIVELCPMEFVFILLPLPFAFYLIAFSEIRKFFDRWLFNMKR